MQEENLNIPPGMTVPIGLGSPKAQPTHRVEAFGTPRAIERGGGPAKTFIPAGQSQHQVTPMFTPGVRLGAVRLANPQMVSQPSVLGQNGDTPPVVVQPGPGTQPPEDPNGKPAWESDKPGKRLAWGKFKKKDAEELAAYLAEIESRMDELNVPSGIVKQIRLKLETFATGNLPPDAEVTVTEEEAVQLNAAIFSLEEAEASKPPSFATAAAVVATLGLISVAVLG